MKILYVYSAMHLWYTRFTFKSVNSFGSKSKKFGSNLNLDHVTFHSYTFSGLCSSFHGNGMVHWEFQKNFPSVETTVRIHYSNGIPKKKENITVASVKTFPAAMTKFHRPSTNEF